MLRQIMGFGMIVVVFTTVAHAQSRGATDVTKAEIEAVYESMGQSIDKQIKVVDIGKDTNVGIGILERGVLASQDEVSAIVHHDVTEVYYILSGGGTLVTGGPVENMQEFPGSTALMELVGPTGGGTFQDGVSREVSEGDIVVIPGGVAHGFSRIPDRVKYLSIRIDPDQFLPAGWVSPELGK